MSGFEAVFGVVTGGAGLISLGLQLGDCARKLNKMYHSIKDAPKSIQRLSLDLETLAMCLQMLEQRRQRQGPLDDVLVRCVTACQHATDETQHLVDKMARRLDEKSKRGQFYVVFKGQDMQELLTDLERTKSSIQLAYMMYQAEEQRQRDEAQNHLLTLHGKVLEGLPTLITTDLLLSNVSNTNNTAQKTKLSRPSK